MALAARRTRLVVVCVRVCVYARTPGARAGAIEATDVHVGRPRVVARKCNRNERSLQQQQPTAAAGTTAPSCASVPRTNERTR